MQHNLHINQDSDLKGSQIIVGQLSGFTQGSAIRIVQNNKQIYTIYRASINQNISLSHNTIKIGKRIMQQNGFFKGTCKVSMLLPFPKKTRTVKVFVSQLDWQIVSSRAEMLQNQFLNQINVIWPNGKIPLYYTPNDCVILNCACDDVLIVDSEAQIQFDVKYSEQKMMQKQENDICQEEILIPDRKTIKYQGKLWTQIIKQDHQNFQFGYENQIEVSKELFKLMKFQKDQYYILETCLPLPRKCLTSIEQYQQYLKNIQPSLNSKDSMRKLEETIVKIMPSQKLENNWFTCSDYFRKLFNVEDMMIINSKKISNFKTITLPMLLKDQDCKITLNPIIKGQIDIQRIKQEFCSNLLTKLCENCNQQSSNTQNINKSMVFVQQGVPVRVSRDCLAFVKFVIKDKNDKAQLAGGLVKIVNTVASSSSKQQIYRLSKQLYSHIQLQVPSVQGISQQIVQLYNGLICDRQGKSNNLSQNPKQTHSTERLIVECYLHIYENQIYELQKHLKSYNCKQTQLNQINQAYYQSFILLTSFAKNGKSLMHKILSIKQYPSWYTNFQSLNNNSLNIQEIVSYIQTLFQLCPYEIIFIDNIDSLCYNVDEGDIHRQQQRIISKYILNKLQKFVNVYGKQVIMTATSKDAIDESFTAYAHIVLKNPEREHRIEVLKRLRICLQEQKESNPQDLLQRKKVQQESVSFTTLMKSVLKQKGSFQIQSNLKKQKVPMDFERLAGLQQAKDYIKRTIQKPIKYSQLYKKLPIKMPRGVLLYGASGTGKSALGNSLKDQFSMKFFSVKGSDILSKYIGGSEAAVREVFEKALSVAPSIIFFDQFESIVPRRNSSNTGVTDRVVNQFLCYLDGVSSITGVFIVAASSRPDLIDPALLRPGRLDIHLHLDFPNETERLELLRMFSQTSITINITDQEFLNATQGYNYSDLIGLMKELRIKKASIALKLNNPNEKDFKQISKPFFQQIHALFKVSTSQIERKRQSVIYNDFKNKKTPDIKQQRAVLF